MVFNSLTFAIFFLIVYALYLVLDHRRQNRMLLAASCVFYGAWDWRFLFLLFLTVLVDYFVALKIHASTEAVACYPICCLACLLVFSPALG